MDGSDDQATGRLGFRARTTAGPGHHADVRQRAELGRDGQRRQVVVADAEQLGAGHVVARVQQAVLGLHVYRCTSRASSASARRSPHPGASSTCSSGSNGLDSRGACRASRSGSGAARSSSGGRAKPVVVEHAARRREPAPGRADGDAGPVGEVAGPAGACPRR
jgi:hypothetical protein